ncbi:MAG: hypothetical protein PW734_08680 [Verrucomicrobium sp.]|nr:hypothetical protein [Verrucomicrobium sp.]
MGAKLKGLHSAFQNLDRREIVQAGLVAALALAELPVIAMKAASAHPEPGHLVVAGALTLGFATLGTLHLGHELKEARRAACAFLHTADDGTPRQER